MGQTVYVLTAKLEGGTGYGPVAVVTDEHTANEWIRSGNDNDWVPLELDDLSTTGMAAKQPISFKPVPAPKRVQQQSTQIEQLKAQVQSLQGVIKDLSKKMRVRGSRTAAISQDMLTEQFFQGRAQAVLNEYLTERGDKDPYIGDFMNWVDEKFAGKVPAERYNIMQSVLFRKYQEMFGPK